MEALNMFWLTKLIKIRKHKKKKKRKKKSMLMREIQCDHVNEIKQSVKFSNTPLGESEEFNLISMILNMPCKKSIFIDCGNYFKYVTSYSDLLFKYNTTRKWRISRYVAKHKVITNDIIEHFDCLI